MSNSKELDLPAITLPDDLTSEEAVYTAPVIKKPLVKPAIKLSHVDQKIEDAEAALAEKLTPEMVKQISKLMEAKAQSAISNANFQSNAAGQVMLKEKAPIVNYSKLTQDDVYDLAIPIDAKPFMDADILKVKLKDENYVCRWVNKNPQRLGTMIARGFLYVEPEDLAAEQGMALEVSKDAEGHYAYHDVVCMKIDKKTYFTALRYAHMRAVNLTKSTTQQQKGISAATQTFREAGLQAGFEEAKAAGKIEFYQPDITI